MGRWEGDTPVVDTAGLNDKVWLAIFRPFSGPPQSEQGHIVERFDRLNLGQLRIEYTINDPGTLAKPWKIRRILTLAPNEEVQEHLWSEKQYRSAAHAKEAVTRLVLMLSFFNCGPSRK